MVIFSNDSAQTMSCKTSACMLILFSYLATRVCTHKETHTHPRTHARKRARTHACARAHTQTRTHVCTCAHTGSRAAHACHEIFLNLFSTAIYMNAHCRTVLEFSQHDYCFILMLTPSSAAGGHVRLPIRFDGKYCLL